MRQEIVTFIVNYTDPDRPVDGARKTRHFATEDEARTFITRLDTLAPNADGIVLTRQISSIRKDILYSES